MQHLRQTRVGNRVLGRHTAIVPTGSNHTIRGATRSDTLRFTTFVRRRP